VKDKKEYTNLSPLDRKILYLF